MELNKKNSTVKETVLREFPPLLKEKKLYLGPI